jgi:PTS system sucrose-specific IIC component
MYQLVLGPGKAKKVTDEFCAQAGIQAGQVQATWEENKAAMKGQQKQSAFKNGLRTIANIFIPLIPAIIAAGLFNGLASALTQIQSVKDAVAAGPEGGFIAIFIALLQLLGASFLSYFAIQTGINAANQFGATPALGGMIGGISIGAQVNTISAALGVMLNIPGMYNAEIPLNSILQSGKGGIIGVIIGVWILAKLERQLRKRIPDVLDLVVTPFVSMLIMGFAYVMVIMPVTGFLSDWLVRGLNLIIASTNPFISVVSGFVLAALFLPMVLLGLHHGLIPIYTIQLETLGGVTLFPVLAMAGAGQVGAALAIYVKARKVKNMRMQKTIIGALPAGILGVGEPLIYGVTLPMGKPFITAGLGAGFGGAFVRMMGVSTVAWGPSGVVATVLMQTPAHIVSFLAGLVISYIAGFIITWIFIKDTDVAAV